MKLYQEAMAMAEEAAFNSRCNSRKIGCVVLNERGYWLGTGFNDTVDPVCLYGKCHKRSLGIEHGDGTFCTATHAEAMAAVDASLRHQQWPEKVDPPHTAVMTCGYPCTPCLAALKKAGIKRIVIKEDVFYNSNDEMMWKELYSKEMEVILYGATQKEKAERHDETEEKAKPHPVQEGAIKGGTFYPHCTCGGTEAHSCID